MHLPGVCSPLHTAAVPRLSRPLFATRDAVTFAARRATNLILSATAAGAGAPHTQAQRPLPPVVACPPPTADLTVNRPYTGQALSAAAAHPEQNRCGECAVMGAVWRRTSGLVGRGKCTHLPIGRTRIKLAAPHNRPRSVRLRRRRRSICWLRAPPCAPHDCPCSAPRACRATQRWRAWMAGAAAIGAAVARGAPLSRRKRRWRVWDGGRPAGRATAAALLDCLRIAPTHTTYTPVCC